jgi:hypothetical protein
MIRITSNIPCAHPPAWAVWERQLIAAMDQSVYPYLAKYTHEDGRLIYRDDFHSRDGADDFYESFFNWPLYYLLGGSDAMLELAHRQWEATTRLLEHYGNIYKEYERGYDQFHQAESYIYFYFLCLADPSNPLLKQRAQRFAGFYLNEDADAPNYDPIHRIIRSPHTGSGGPIAVWQEGLRYGYSPGMARYGLPFEDVPGVRCIEDLKNPELALCMGETMRQRMSWGDVPANLTVTSTMANAYFLSGDEKYVRWTREYVDAWVERARANGGLLPDNIGLTGKMGETMDGKWYGGHYGWTWPHGFYNIGMSACVAATNAYLLTGEASYLDLARAQMDGVMAHGEERDVDAQRMSLREHWVGIWRAAGGQGRLWLVPYRYADSGWFDYQPMSPLYPVAVWNVTQEEADWQRVAMIRARSGYDWRKVFAFRTKEESGHEAPWIAFLRGENPTYPEEILAASYEEMARRLTQIREDNSDLMKNGIHHWQNLNPVSTEALVQLTLGAPQALYNGGLLMARLRYYDAERRRPGLPPDVAALVQTLEPGRTVVRLVNLSAQEPRTLIVQGGAFGEHRLASVRYPTRTSEYPGRVGSYAAAPVTTEERTAAIGGPWVEVHLPPASEMTLDLEMERYANRPSYAHPW